MKNISEFKLPSLSSLIFYLLIVSLLLVELGVAVYVLPNRVANLAETRQQTIDLQEKNKQLQTALDEVSSLNSEQVAIDLEKVNTAIPDEKRVSGLVTGLSDLASTSGVIVTQLSFSPGVISTSSAETTIGQGGSIPVSVSLTGDLQSIRDFVSKIIEANQIINVIGVSYASSQLKKSGDLSILIYYQPVSNRKIDWPNFKPLTTGEQKVIDSLTGLDIFSL